MRLLAWQQRCALLLCAAAASSGGGASSHASAAAGSIAAAGGPPPFNCSTQPAGAFAPITLRNARGTLNVTFLPYGGTVRNVRFADARGVPTDLVLGFDDGAQYCANAQHPYFGALIGRVANRIANGSFSLNGVAYTTPINEPLPAGGNDTLHGGWVGFDRRVYAVTQTRGGAAELRYTSADGEEGFPGALAVAITYTVDDENTWWIDYEATAAADTVVGLTQHSYWNLNGAVADVTEHILTLPGAHTVLAVDAHLIPTGAFTDVRDAPWLDFNAAKAIGRDIANGTVAPGGGYDNAWVFDAWAPGAAPVLRAVAVSPRSGIRMEVHTDQPSLQFYSGNFLNGSIPRKADQGEGVYVHWGALALEAQHFPDAVHHQGDPRWPSVVLRAGQTYRQRTGYRFSHA